MSIQCLTADSQLISHSFDTSACGIDDTSSDTSQLEDGFATMPEMPAISTIPTYQSLNEEELHTSFEQAISDRVLIVNKQLSRKSDTFAHTYTYAQYIQPQLASESLHHSTLMVHRVPIPVQEQPQVTLFSLLLGNIWQRSLIFVCMALMFMLIGFDLMGLLVLHVH